MVGWGGYVHAYFCWRICREVGGWHIASAAMGDCIDFYQ